MEDPSVPTLVAFFDGKEWLRKGRSFGLEELRAELARPYALLFNTPMKHLKEVLR